MLRCTERLGAGEGSLVLVSVVLGLRKDGGGCADACCWLLPEDPELWGVLGDTSTSDAVAVVAATAAKAGMAWEARRFCVRAHPSVTSRLPV